MFLSKEAVVLCLAASISHVQSQTISKKTFTAVESTDNYILYGEYIDNLQHSGPISVSSNVPLTIQSYSDNEFLQGEEPLSGSEATVLITSDCAATTFIPEVSIDKDTNSININVKGVPNDMSYLESSSYEVEWSVDIRGAPMISPNSPCHLNEGRAISLRKLSTKLTKNKLPQLLVSSLSSSSNNAVCNVNAEIMIDSCSHSVEVSSSTPSLRVIDSKLENTTWKISSEDECVQEQSTGIMFTSQPIMNITDNNVEQKRCYRPVPGRPFIDTMGKVLQAEAVVGVDVGMVSMKDNLWSAGKDNQQQLMEIQKTLSDNNNTSITPNQLSLGKEWMTNALGEHASVASFSAFSIALMTNGAPSDLVEDALKAALDEVRHAKTSFDIASMLMGKDVEPGALPTSSHKFDHDLKALAVAVAKEGCVDETLSALELAAKIELLDAVLSNEVAVEATKYADIDRNIITWIRHELHTIAMEESSHASLAWRTIDWVCTIDDEACIAVKEEVLNKDELEKAFHHRFGSSVGSNFVSLDAIKDSWNEIIHAGLLNSDDQVCIDEDSSVDEVNGKSIINQM